MKKRDCTIYVAKTKALISCAVTRTADLLLSFRIYAKSRFSHDAAHMMDDLVSATNLKFHGVKVMVSLGLPRGNQMANAQVIDQSNKLVRKFNRNKTVTVCDNSRLFFKGKPSKGILRDDKHLSKKGTTILAQNIKRAIENVFSIA